MNLKIEPDFLHEHGFVEATVQVGWTFVSNVVLEMLLNRIKVYVCVSFPLLPSFSLRFHHLVVSNQVASYLYSSPPLLLRPTAWKSEKRQNKR